MGTAENVDVVALYAAAFVLSSVDDAIDHNFCSKWDHPWVNCDGVVYTWDRANVCAVDRRPLSAADRTFAIAGQTEHAERSQPGSCLYSFGFRNLGYSSACRCFFCTQEYLEVFRRLRKLQYCKYLPDERRDPDQR